VAVYQLNPADIPAGHAIIKDGIVLLEADQSGRLITCHRLNRRARQSVNQRPEMVLTPLPASVRAAVEPLAERACKYMLSTWVLTWVPGWRNQASSHWLDDGQYRAIPADAGRSSSPDKLV
jgi:hypothetical protein